MSIGNKKSVEELVRQVEGMGAMVEQDGDNWTIALGPQQILANLNDERILITNSKTIYDKALQVLPMKWLHRFKTDGWAFIWIISNSKRQLRIFRFG